MVRKKLDERIRILIEKGVLTKQRSILVLVGDHGKDQVPNLHHILSKTCVKAQPKVLWCYKKELGFSTHRTKRMKKIKRDKARGLSKGANDTSADQMVDHFELFLTSTDINWCYYRDTHRVLGTTVGMLVLQDFEALTPNLMARTIETVEGGGLIIFLLKTVKSLKQLYTMTMDVHARFRTESSGDVVPRFNERFLLSLGKCENCLVCDDELNILPLSKKSLQKLGDPEVLNNIKKGDAGEILMRKSREEMDLDELKDSLIDTPHVGVLVQLTVTLDQARAVLTFLEACSEKTNKSTVTLTAARGRGKSAAIGLCLAGAISFGYSSIVVTAPEPENLVSVFDFVIRGLKALKFQEHLDYSISYDGSSGRERIKCIVAVELHRDHRQSIKYVRPDQPDKISSAELLAIDEAAAIPLPTVRALMGDRLTFLSSTVNGYEGTGRSLSLKLIKELRDSKRRKTDDNVANAISAVAGPKSNKGENKVHEQRWAVAAQALAKGLEESTSNGSLREIELTTPIRYSRGDPVESWLNKLLCLDSGNSESLKLISGAPAPSDCELYYVDRDALFSFHKLSEAFLQKLMALYTSAHYKNTPNDLQMLSDAPAHSVFVLLSPTAENDTDSLPDIMAVVQVALEGQISKKAVQAQLARGHRSAGDLIPWAISQQFGDSNFAQLSGARIVRVAVHPSLQSMGYGSRAIDLLHRYYNGEIFSFTNNLECSSDEGEESDSSSGDRNTGYNSFTGIQGENLVPRKRLPPLLLPIAEVKAPKLDWIGTSFGLTYELHQFWKRNGMHLLYLRQTKNELTGENSAIMIRALPKRTGFDDAWLPAFICDTKRRIISLLAGVFRDMNVKLAMAILEQFETTTVSNRKVFNNQEASDAIGQRSGFVSEKATLTELSYLLTPHDLKRVDLYGRNLCDHYLIADLLPAMARLYFSGRLGADFKLSGLQAAIICGLGLQNRTIEEIGDQLGLPSNQILAIFNKTVRKISLCLNLIAEKTFEEELLAKDDIVEAENGLNKLKDVYHQTLDEDAEDGAEDVIGAFGSPQLPMDILNDSEMGKFIVKGDVKQWNDALMNKNGSLEEGLVQIKIDGTIAKRKPTNTNRGDINQAVNEKKKKRKMEKINNEKKPRDKKR